MPCSLYEDAGRSPTRYIRIKSLAFPHGVIVVLSSVGAVTIFESHLFFPLYPGLHVLRSLPFCLKNCGQNLAPIASINPVKNFPSLYCALFVYLYKFQSFIYMSVSFLQSPFRGLSPAIVPCISASLKRVFTCEGRKSALFQIASQKEASWRFSRREVL